MRKFKSLYTRAIWLQDFFTQLLALYVNANKHKHTNIPLFSLLLRTLRQFITMNGLHFTKRVVVIYTIINSIFLFWKTFLKKK